MENNQTCLHSVMEELHALLRSINPFAESYRQMHQLMQSNPAVNVKMIFMEHPDFDFLQRCGVGLLWFLLLNPSPRENNSVYVTVLYIAFFPSTTLHVERMLYSRNKLPV
ncbi:hypothetical protein AVEN_4707-1 [Araneus ventricosus]|uniref:Uncharacterized protein n=1 Tax=Araneus ventricosus TaxID=182803 RepID=A0A4Y1ZQH6_ARAVE|nr:hypothetical protein AVEN_4707-1 [Araneus ventricosus]